MAAAAIAGRQCSRPTSRTTSSSRSSAPRSRRSSATPSGRLQVSADAPEPGVLLVDKPAGITSHDVVARVRRERGQKTGHAGTLDPFATGLLLLLLGREATRLQARFMALRKVYRVVARFGVVSTTGDPDGEMTGTGRMPPHTLELP